MTYILDLRKKINPQVQIVEKVIFQKQPWYIETLKVFLAIVIVSSAVWGISKADDLISDRPVSSKPFSVMGVVSSISETSLSLHVTASDKETDYVFDTAPITTIQTSEYANITLQDIKVGDKIIVQGRESDGIPQPTRIISFSSVAIPTPSDEVATTTASTTPEALVSVSTTTATTTIETPSSSTPEITSTSTPTATTSEEVASSTPGVVETIINTVQEVIQNIVETLTGSSTPPVEEATPEPEVPEVVEPEVPTPPVETPVDTSDASAPALTS